MRHGGVPVPNADRGREMLAMPGWSQGPHKGDSMTAPVTDEEARAIVDRYRRGQALTYISMGTGRSVALIKRVLAEAGERIRKPGKNSNGWGWTGL
jgi:hypothetical protein